MKINVNFVFVLSVASAFFSQSIAMAAAEPEKVELGSWFSPAVGTIVAAGISLVGVFVSVFLARRTSLNTMLAERSKRHGELALKISELVSDADKTKRHAAMRRFAVAVVKIVYAHRSDSKGYVYFIPMNSRVTIGRDEDNDIVLDDTRQFLSRWHCGFSSDEYSVYIDDYISTNGTLVNGTKITHSTKLKDGDLILLGTSELQFRYIKENSILTR